MHLLTCHAAPFLCGRICCAAKPTESVNPFAGSGRGSEMSTGRSLASGHRLVEFAPGKAREVGDVLLHFDWTGAGPALSVRDWPAWAIEERSAAAGTIAQSRGQKYI